MARSREWRFFQAGLVVADSLTILLAFALAYYFRFASGIWAPSSTPILNTHFLASLFSLPLWLVLFALHGLYNPARLLEGPREYSSIVNASTYGVLVLVAVSYLAGGPPLMVARAWLLMAWGFAIVFVAISRFILRRVVFYLRARGLFVSRAIIAGANDQGVAIARQLEPSATSGIQVIGFVDEYLPVGTPVADKWSVLGAVTTLDRLVEEYRAQEIIIIPQAIGWESLEESVRRASTQDGVGATIRLSPGIYDLVANGVTVSRRGNIPLLTLDQRGIAGIDALLKAALDWGLAAMLLIAMVPLWVLAAYLWLTGRSRLSRAIVLGRNSRPFPMLVFGSTSSPTGASIPTGWRRAPALLNVLKRQMSLVGPRPITPEELTLYGRWATMLLSVRPGLIGMLAFGDRSLSREERMRLDIYYIRSYSIWLDLQAVFQSVRRFLPGEPSYPKAASEIIASAKAPANAISQEE